MANRLYNRNTVVVPFGLAAGNDLRAESIRDEFSVQLRDANGAPLIYAAMDTLDGRFIVVNATRFVIESRPV